MLCKFVTIAASVLLALQSQQSQSSAPYNTKLTPLNTAMLHNVYDARETSGAGFTALPRTACFKLCATANRVFSTELYRVPRLFNAALPRTASFQLDMTAYRVFSEGNYRIPRLFWDPPIEFRIHLCTGKLQRGLSVLLSYFSIIYRLPPLPPSSNTR